MKIKVIAGVVTAEAETREDIETILGFKSVNLPPPENNNGHKRGYRTIVCPKKGQNGCRGFSEKTGTKFSKRGLRIHDLRIHQGHNWSARILPHD